MSKSTKLINEALAKVRTSTDQPKTFKAEYFDLYTQHVSEEDLRAFEDLARKEFEFPIEVIIEAQDMLGLMIGHEDVEELPLFPPSKEDENEDRDLSFEDVLLNAWLDRYSNYLRHYRGEWWGLTKRGHWIRGIDTRCVEFMWRLAKRIANKIKGKRARRSAHNQINFHIQKRVLQQAAALLAFEEDGYTKSHPDKPIFDQNKHLLGVLSGVVDLRTGKIRAAQPNEYVHKRLSYDPLNSECPHFERVLEHASENDTATYDFLLGFLGLCLTGEIEGNHYFLFIHGEPGTGKSTLVDTMLDVLEFYSSNVESEHFIKSRYQPHTQWLAGLESTRLAVISELPDRAVWDTIKLNRITDGSRMTANRMRENDIQFDSQMKVIVCGNHEPRFDVRDGISRRVLVLNMNNAPSEIDLHLKGKLREERGAILHKLIAKASEFYTLGELPSVPDLMRTATAQYVHEQDSVALFVEEQCVLDQHESITLKELYERYRAVCDEEGRKHLTKSKFRDRLLDAHSDLNYIEDPYKKRWIEGINLTSQPEES